MLPSEELIVVVHGFAGKRIWMKYLSRQLNERFQVVNWAYNSVSGSLQCHAERLNLFLNQIEHDGPISIVAHSMGSIVTRAALLNGSIKKLNRIVLLAPPNSGSPVAQMFGWVCRPLRELSSSERSYVNLLPKRMPCDTGVIAARFDS